MLLKEKSAINFQLMLADELAKNDQLKSHLNELLIPYGIDLHDPSLGQTDLESIGTLLATNHPLPFIPDHILKLIEHCKKFSKNGEEPIDELDDRTDMHKVATDEYWHSLLNSCSGAIWANDHIGSLKERVVQNSSAVCWFVHNNNLNDHQDKMKSVPLHERVKKLNYNEDNLPLHPNEPFYSQPSVTGCTGFLIAPDIVLSTDHWFLMKEGHDGSNGEINWRNEKELKEFCDNVRVVFGYQSSAAHAIDQSVYIPFKNRYKIKKVLAVSNCDTISDWIILKLDRSVEGVAPLKIATDPAQTFDSVYMIGHPMGLPKKFAPDARVLCQYTNDYWYTNLDAFAGNSGSPVLDANSHHVVGIFKGGKGKEFVPDESGNYLKSWICKEIYELGISRPICASNACFEKFQSTASIIHIINNILT